MNKLVLTIAIITLAVTNSWAQSSNSTMDSDWKKINPDELSCKPIDLFGNQWMALAMGNKEKMNSMTIAWGTIGKLWQKDVVIVYVSSSRYSKHLMDENDYFTVTAFPENDEACRNALVYIGTHSQKNEADKTAKSGLITEYTEKGNPIFKQGNLAIECKKIYADEFKEALVPEDVKQFFYNGKNGIHTFYIGEIENIWTKKGNKK